MSETVRCCISETELFQRKAVQPDYGFDWAQHPDIFSLTFEKDVLHLIWVVTCRVRDGKGKAVEDWLRCQLGLDSSPDSKKLLHYEFAATSEVIYRVCGDLAPMVVSDRLRRLPGVMWAKARRVTKPGIPSIVTTDNTNQVLCAAWYRGHFDVIRGNGEDTLRKLQKDGFQFSPHISFPWHSEWRTSN